MTDEEQAPPLEAGGARKRRRRRGKGRGGQGAGAERGPSSYWMVVSSPENLRRTRELGFRIQGIKSRHRRRVEAMRPGDRIIYYVTGRMAFAATATVTSPMFEDHQRVWHTARPEEDYPWRVHIRLDRLLEDAEWIDARGLAFRLEYVRKWPPEHWTLAFQGHLHQLPKVDFQLLEGEVNRRRAPLEAPAS